MPQFAYIHIPFCERKCSYCDFAIWLTKEDSDLELYTRALIREIEARELDTGSQQTLGGLFCGGGTPSLLPLALWNQIFVALRARFCFAPDAEISLEANPGKLTIEYLQGLRKLGFNRLSLGAQSFNAEILKVLNRTHTPAQISETLSLAHQAGFRDISLDLIYGLPAQSPESFGEETRAFLEKHPEITHLSLYNLTIEPNTAFGRVYRPQDDPSLPSEDQQVSMYELALTLFAEFGFEQYEVSNFCKPDFQSKHNQNYWRGGEYWGFGVSAHEYRAGQRWAHNREMGEYICNPLMLEALETDRKLEDFMLALRTSEGLDLEAYERKHGYDPLAGKAEFINKLEAAGFIVFVGGRLALTGSGHLRSNGIIGGLWG